MKTSPSDPAQARSAVSSGVCGAVLTCGRSGGISIAVPRENFGSPAFRFAFAYFAKTRRTGGRGRRPRCHAAHSDMQKHVATNGVVAVAAVSSDAGRHALGQVRRQEIGLIGGCIGVNGGSDTTARVGNPAGGLSHVVAGRDVHVGTSCIVNGCEVDGGSGGDSARADTGSAIAGAVAAGRDGRIGEVDCVEMDRNWHLKAPWLALRSMRPNLDGADLGFAHSIGQAAKI